MAVQCSFFRCDHPSLLGFVCVRFSALRALLLLQCLLVSLLHIKALCSSNGKLVLKVLSALPQKLVWEPFMVPASERIEMGQGYFTDLQELCFGLVPPPVWTLSLP